MARSYAEWKAQQAAFEKAAGIVPAAPAATPPKAPTAAVPSTTQPRPAPTVTRAAQAVEQKDEDRRKSAEEEARKKAERDARKAAEKAAKDAAAAAAPAAAPAPFVLPPDVAEVVDYRQVHTYSDAPSVDSAVKLAAKNLGMEPQRLKDLASAQGVDLNAIYAARNKGRTYEEIERANRERGVVGFLPVAEREARFRDDAEAADKARRGQADDTPIELQAARAGAQTIMGTSEELPEVTKPGEHGYTLASMLVDSLLKQDRPSELYDLYGRKTATGATQQYVEDRVKDLVRSTNLRADTPNFDERMQALRRRAFNEVLAYKTIGMWTPVITAMDVEAVEGRRDPTLWEAATTPNIEIIGVNNKNQAIYRMESPLGVVMRTFDLPQSALVGVISGQGAARGVQTGANFLEFALDATEGQSGFVRVPAVAAGLAASIFAPDVLSTGAAALKGVRAVSQARRVAAVAPRAVELMEQVSNARAAGRFDDAAKAEVKLRNEFPAVADDLDRKDARMAESLDIIDPKADILNEDLASLLGSQIPLGSAREAAQYRPYLHPSRRRQVLQGATPSGQTASFPDYADLFDTKKQLEAVQKAKTDYVTNGPQTVEEYAAARLRGAVRSVFASLPADGASAVDINDVEKLADDMAAQAALALSDPSKFADEAKKLIGTTIKGTDDNSKAVRKAFYARRNAIAGKVDSLRGADIQALQTADLALFERMEKAVEANNEARGAAAALLRDQLAEDARIIVQPLNIFDKVAVKTPAGEPVRLTEGGHISLFSLRKAAPNMDFKEAYSAAAMIDAAIRAQAMKRGIDPYELYKNIFPDLRKGTAHDLERFLKQMASKGPPPASSVPPSAVPFKTSVSAEAALEATPPIPAGYTATDIEKVDAAKRLIKEALAGDIPDVLTRVVESGTQKTVESLSVIVGDARIVIDRTPNVEEFNVIVTLGEGADRKVTTLTKVKGNQAALTRGEKALEALMNARVKAKGPAIVGAPVKTPAAAKATPPAAPGAAPTPTPAAPAPAAAVPAAAPAPSRLPVLADTIAERKEQLREYLRANPGIQVKPLFTQFQLTPNDVKQIHREVKAEREAAAAAAKATAPQKFGTATLQREGGIGYNQAAELAARVQSGELTEAQAIEEARRMGGGAAAPAPTTAGPATPAPIAATAEAQAEAAKIAEAPAPAKRPRASRGKKAEAAPVTPPSVVDERLAAQDRVAKTEAKLAARPELNAEIEAVRDVAWTEKDGKFVAQSGRFSLTITPFKSRSKKNPVYYNLDVSVPGQRVARGRFIGVFKSLDEAKASVVQSRVALADAALDAEAATVARKASQEFRASEAARLKAQEAAAQGAPNAAQAEAEATAKQRALQATMEEIEDLGVARVPADQSLPSEMLERADDGEWVDPRLVNERFRGLEAIKRPRKGRAMAQMLDLVERANGDLSVAVREIANTTTVPEFKLVAERILALEDEARQSPLRLVRPGDQAAEVGIKEGAAGWYDPSDSTVNLFGPEYTSYGLSEETLLHETLHALTHKRLRYDAASALGPPALLTKESRAALEEGTRAIKQVHADLVAHVRRAVENGTATPFEKSVAMSDYLLSYSPDELVSWALTDAGFQDYLKTVKLPKQAATLWQKFVRGMGMVLGFDIEETSALARVIEATDQLLTAKYERIPDVTQELVNAASARASELTAAAYDTVYRRTMARIRQAAQRGVDLGVTEADAQRARDALFGSSASWNLSMANSRAPFRTALLDGNFEEARRLIDMAATEADAAFEAALKELPDVAVPPRRGRAATTLHAELRADFQNATKSASAKLEAALSDLERAAKAAPEAQAPVPSGITAAAEGQIEDPNILKQVTPAGQVKGAVETLADGKTILYLFEGADASTIIHEAGHILRRSILDNEDMGSITNWIKSQGVNVSHEFGEFVGDAQEPGRERQP